MTPYEEDINMKYIPVFVFLSIVPLLAASEGKTPRHPVIDSGRLIDVYYKAVDRGELRVFDMVIPRKHIKPVEITYSYDLRGYQNTVLVIAKTTKRIICPTSKHFYIDSITARLNDKGKIIESWHDMKPIQHIE
jgi:hypothetical protein